MTFRFSYEKGSYHSFMFLLISTFYYGLGVQVYNRLPIFFYLSIIIKINISNNCFILILVSILWTFIDKVVLFSYHTIIWVFITILLDFGTLKGYVLPGSSPLIIHVITSSPSFSLQTVPRKDFLTISDQQLAPVSIPKQVLWWN